MTLSDLGTRVIGWTPPPVPGPAVISGRFIRLERLALSHADSLFAANRVSDAIWDYMPYGPFADIDGYRAWVTQMGSQSDPFFYALCDTQTGAALGVASYLRITPAAGSIEVGHINLSPALQKTPSATEAMFLMMDWAFGAGYRRYEWKCNALNRASRRAAERLGMSYEGTFRQAAVVKGRNRDTAWFAAIDSEWPRLRKAFDRWLSPVNFDTQGQQKQSLVDFTAPILVTRDPGP
jgi:RimJ/RimL family protein N-acetyltransferase